MPSIELIIFVAIVVATLIASIIYAHFQKRVLKNHVNARCIRELHDFFTNPSPEQKTLDGFWTVLRKTRNDVSMLFYLYCRIYDDFSKIPEYINYKTYKRINKKRKPFPFNFVFFGLLILLGCSRIFGFAGLGLGNIDTLIVVIIIGTFSLIHLLIAINTINKTNTYWMEFINLFSRITIECGPFFAEQEQHYKSFKHRALSELMPRENMRHRVEKIIQKESAFLHGRPTSYGNPQSADVADPATALASTPAQTPGATTYGMSPSNEVHASQTIHNTQTSIVHAQNQVMQQMMLAMQQQNMQQSYMVQRAIESQHAIAQNVLQQNVMAMRYEAQKDLHHAISGNPYLPPQEAKNQSKLEQPPVAPVVSTVVSSVEAASALGEKPFVEVPLEKQPVADISEPTQQEKLQDKPPIAKEKSAIEVVRTENLTKAFTVLDKAFNESNQQNIELENQKANNVEDVIIIEPEREQTAIEDKVGKIFNAKLYKYTDEEWKNLASEGKKNLP